jgi:hypothetical protein
LHETRNKKICETFHTIRDKACKLWLRGGSKIAKANRAARYEKHLIFFLDVEMFVAFVPLSLRSQIELQDALLSIVKPEDYFLA